MVEGAADRIQKWRRARTPLAVSRPQSTSAADYASVRSTVQGGRQSRGAAQDGLAAFASPQLCDTSARARRGHSRDSSVARTFQARDDNGLPKATLLKCKGSASIYSGRANAERIRSS